MQHVKVEILDICWAVFEFLTATLEPILFRAMNMYWKMRPIQTSWQRNYLWHWVLNLVLYFFELFFAMCGCVLLVWPLSGQNYPWKSEITIVSVWSYKTLHRVPVLFSRGRALLSQVTWKSYLLKKEQTHRSGLPSAGVEITERLQTWKEEGLLLIN